ncbi:MAG: sugar ABC transporter substrate-binding protein [Arachnia sp.]
MSVLGCTPSASTNNNQGGGTSVEGAAKTVTVWHYYSVDAQVAALDAYKQSFEAAHEGVTVENVYVPQDQINAKVITAAGSGTGPDVVVFDGYSATTLIAGNALQPLDSYWAGFEGADQVAEGAIAQFDGKTYSVQGYVNTLALFYNKDVLAEAGVEPPTTMEELEAAMEKVATVGKQGIVLSGQPDVQGAFQAYPWITYEGFTYENPAADALVAAFSRVRGWVEKGWLSQQVATWDQNVPFTQFVAGGIAFAQNGNWQLSNIRENSEFEWGVVPLPVGPNGKIYLGGEAQGIGSQSKDPDLAWQYLSETFFAKDGQLEAMKHMGAIPTRTDAADDKAIADDPELAVFAKAIAEQGAPFPDVAIPAENNEATILANGQAWSAALGGQTTAEDAAAEFLAKLETLLKKS